jgi:hypothetical protein
LSYDSKFKTERPSDRGEWAKIMFENNLKQPKNQFDIGTNLNRDLISNIFSQEVKSKKSERTRNKESDITYGIKEGVFMKSLRLKGFKVYYYRITSIEDPPYTFKVEIYQNGS